MSAGSSITQKKDGRARMQPSTKGAEISSIEDVGIAPYENLANAIVKQAVIDYKDQLHLLLINPNSREAMQEAQRLERFFHSGWYTCLTSLDGKRLINGVRILVRKEAAEKERQGILEEAQKYRKQAESLRNGEPVPEATGGKEYTTEEAMALAGELEQKADALKSEAVKKKPEVDELERQAIKAVGFLVKEPKRKGRSK